LECLPFRPRKPNSDGNIRILIAAALREKKGIPYALEAFAKVCEARKNLHLTVIGDARPQKDEQMIKRQMLGLVSRYGLGEKVSFMGSQPYDVLIEQYYRHHVFISPSVQAADGDNEGGAPLTIVEALAKAPRPHYLRQPLERWER
jgi:colanic acid/amylovoran biosynthesis glycosyltransferase